MPIPKDRFETLEETGVSPQTNAERIVEFLLSNRDLAYRMSEIADELNIPRGSVGPTLKRLEDDGLVVHRDRYWAIDETYAASREGMALTGAAAAEYDDGKGFDVDAWAEAAEDATPRDGDE
ncbi:MarR family transcriptional regulator [Haloglomus litoreum]|uniref:MarR family transcriptional regulator n=1 Tax=Haloglomus litoreum TaxID=3034026 RepID=UPI0023E77AD5|nr:MarR family transcriptional regulator [Haloglomus sp. DT116]